jgi:sugar transferase EpsL
MMRYELVKRILDIAAVAAIGVLALPIGLTVAAFVRLRLGTPVLFRQERPGLHGRPFVLLKFRTMTDARDAKGSPLPDDVRLTAIGRLLRSLSLDELPQLLNVLCGDMSLVGPRPLLMQYLDRYTPRQARRMEVRPGITGWAQVNGRNALSWEERFELDVWYVEHQSFLLDLKILMLTALRVVQRDGVSAQGHVTMPEFTGSPSRADDGKATGRGGI